MTNYLGALSHGAHTIVINRDGRHIRWLLGTPAGVITDHDGPPHAAQRLGLTPDALAKNIQRLGITWPAALTTQSRLHA